MVAVLQKQAEAADSHVPERRGWKRIIGVPAYLFNITNQRHLHMKIEAARQTITREFHVLISTTCAHALTSCCVQDGTEVWNSSICSTALILKHMDVAVYGYTDNTTSVWCAVKLHIYLLIFGMIKRTRTMLLVDNIFRCCSAKFVTSYTASSSRMKTPSLRNPRRQAEMVRLKMPIHRLPRFSASRSQASSASHDFEAL